MSILNGSTLTLYGVVSAEKDDARPSFSALEIRQALDEHGPGDIAVNLNSGGGVALEGLAIYNALSAHQGRVIVTVDAIAASAASLIAMAGDRIIMRDGALMMIHDPSTITSGTSRELRKTAAHLDILASQFCAIYARRSGKPEKEVCDLMIAETWMAADEAVQMGFATEKAKAPATLTFAEFDYRKYRKTPSSLNDGEISMSTQNEPELSDKAWAGRFYLSAGKSGIDIASLNEIVTASASHDDARDALIEAMGKKQRNLPSGVGPRRPEYNDQTFSNPAFVAKVVGDVLHARMSGATPEGPARELMGCTILDLGARLLESQGERVSWVSRDDLTSRVMMSGGHSTSDFPNLLTASGNRVLRDAYELSQSPLKLLARRRNAVDFRPLTSIRLSEAPRLVEKPEASELTYGSRTEAKESFSLKTAGRVFALTREAIINDDLHAFADSARAWGRSAAGYEAGVLAALFSLNTGDGVNLDDGSPLYTTGRGNKAVAGAAINTTALGAARQAMRGFTDIDGKTLIGVAPAHLVVGPAKETEAEQALAAVAAAQTSNANPFANKLSLHVEPRFAGNAWRLFADPAQMPVIVIAYLNGAEGPQMASREGWTTLGMEFRAILDFGAGVEDWRGTYLNQGN